MEGFTFILRAIESGRHVALALAIVSGGVIAAHVATRSAGLPEPGLFGEWVGWANVGLGLGIGIALIGIVTRAVHKVGSAAKANRARKEQAEASRLQAEAAKREVTLAQRNIATLGRDERLLFMDALKRHPCHIEVLEFGASRSLIKKDILRIVGEGPRATLICEVHPWLVMHRIELINFIEVE
jgi:hypothetical protein